MSRFPSWRFREMDRGEVNVDPVYDEFFKAQDLADALVREAIQNSLDARRGHSLVRVGFRFGRDPLPGIYDGLGEHLEACGVPLPDSHAFLVIEDFGTRGLIGDPTIDPEIEDEPAERNDFYYFFRNVGRSSKGELDRGRWGLGKAVFTVASRIRTLFGLTLRAGDQRALLLGQAVLKTHIVGSRRIDPYGFFGRSDRGFPLPIEDDDLLERFADGFGLERSEPGLSIVIPFVRDDDLSFECIAVSAVRQYFYPIIRGDLVVTIEDNGRAQTIQPRSIDSVEGSDPALKRLCALTRWSVALPEEERTELPAPPPSGAPSWRGEIPISDSLRARFERGEPLAFRIPVAIRRKKSRAAMSYFDLFLERDDELKRGEHHFIRRGITIPEVKTSRSQPVRALVVVDDDALARFLGDAENPAHTDWSERSDKIRTLYEHGPWTVRYIKQSVDRLVAALARPPEGRMRDLLAEIFSVPAGMAGAEEDAGPRGEEHGTIRTPEPNPPAHEAQPRPRPAISATRGGFTIHGSGDPSDAGVPFVAEMAYRTRSGNPFRKYSPFDFEIGAAGIDVEVQGALIRSAAGNRVEFIPSRPDFRLSVAGFDCRRDVMVRLQRQGEESE